jgi:hypothetical protein
MRNGYASIAKSAKLNVHLLWKRHISCSQELSTFSFFFDVLDPLACSYQNLSGTMNLMNSWSDSLDG